MTNLEKCPDCQAESHVSVPCCTQCGVHKSSARAVIAAVEKSTMDTIAKASALADEEVSKAAVAFAEARALYELDHPDEGIVGFMQTAEGRQLYAAHRRAEKRRAAGPVEIYTKAIDQAIDKIDAEIEKSIEEFSVAHNLERVDARMRLRKISPSFAALEKSRHAADNERSAAVTKARIDAEQRRGAAVVKAHYEHVDAEAEEMYVAMTTPSERALAELAKAKGMRLADVVRTPEGRKLYAKSIREKKGA